MSEITERRRVLSELAGMIDRIRLPHPVRVGIDGVDCSGKTRLADELAELLSEMRREVVRVSADGFHNPRSIRYRQGRKSPMGFFNDTFNHDAIVSNVLVPLGPDGDRRYNPCHFDFKIDSPVPPVWNSTAPDSILLFDGIFLHRRELIEFWDFTVFVRVSFDETLKRAKDRDGYLFGSVDEIEAIYRERYIPGQKIYLESESPDGKANVVMDNNDIRNPSLIVNRNAR